jgi:hypothetical protein
MLSCALCGLIGFEDPIADQKGVPFKVLRYIHLCRTRRKILEGPPYLVVFLSLFNFLRDFHNGSVETGATVPALRLSLYKRGNKDAG